MNHLIFIRGSDLIDSPQKSPFIGEEADTGLDLVCFGRLKGGSGERARIWKRHVVSGDTCHAPESSN